MFVSGATSCDVLLGTDWLSHAHAEISFAKQEISFRIDLQMTGRIPITVMPAIKNSTRYCAPQAYGEDPVDAEEPAVPMPPEINYIEASTSDDTAAEEEFTASKETPAIADTHESDLDKEDKSKYEENSQVMQSDYQSATIANTSEIEEPHSLAAYDKYL